ncbi:glycosyl hydrolase family 8 [Sulfitobacter delicatus]|uniref:cellulase n=1 Tax=Sulfitobacter delicatus TaxID=218672 RepID=A0A1G7SLG1_9RHOB|nr:glycosyl hydrolase family 8 [Sulfitobacter delicatus]SDG23771.1 endoglucanase [Sulfitobacter delicatus]
MNRRQLLMTLPCIAMASSAWGQDLTLDNWSAWKAAYLNESGRVIDDGNDGISHSEGQAYGLLLAQAFGDRDAFRRIEGWTQSKLAIRPDGLMAWKWQADGVADLRNATDGDLLRAWALLRAARDSGWGEYEGKAAQICRGLVETCLAPDPRVANEFLLKPASHMTATDQSVIVNPSYYMSRALIELGEAFGLVDLLRTAAHGEQLLRDPAALRDWINVTPSGMKAATDLSNAFGWDALRIPLYLFWSGRHDHPALGAASTRFASATLAEHVATVTAPSGQLIAQSDAAGFRAVADLAAKNPPAKPRPGQSYYADTLALLAQIAWREGI